MSEAHDVELKPADKLAEAGIMLVQQAGMSLLSDSYQFPQALRGKITPDDKDGSLNVQGPFNESLKTFMKERHDEKTTYFGTWTHTDVMDQSHRNISTKDEVNGGEMMVVLATNRLGSHTDFKRADGSLQFKMDGQTQLTPKDGVIRDATNVFTDENGNYIGEMHLVAKPVAGNMLGIAAQYKYHDTYLGDVELVMTLDPNTQYSSADIQLAKKYNPPPPPPVAPPVAAAAK